jgi:hypothetical protein
MCQLENDLTFIKVSRFFCEEIAMLSCNVFEAVHFIVKIAFNNLQIVINRNKWCHCTLITMTSIFFQTCLADTRPITTPAHCLTHSFTLFHTFHSLRPTFSLSFKVDNDIMKPSRAKNRTNTSPITRLVLGRKERMLANQSRLQQFAATGTESNINVYIYQKDLKFSPLTKTTRFFNPKFVLFFYLKNYESCCVQN